MLFTGNKKAELTPREAAEQLGRGEITLVDVREPQEWSAGHVQGARHIPLGELDARLPELPEAPPAAFLCASGARSKLAMRIAARHGRAAGNVTGGLKAWLADEVPLTGSRTRLTTSGGTQ